MNHSPEPWTVKNKQIVAANGECVADWCVGNASCEEMGDWITPSNLRRITACINACKDTPTEQLPSHHLIRYAALTIQLLKLDGDSQEADKLRDHMDTGSVCI